jgi:FkbM family methyltransferase
LIGEGTKFREGDRDLKRRMTRLRLIPRWIRGARKRYIRLVHGDEYFITRYFDTRFLVRPRDFVPREIALRNFEPIQLQHCIDACKRMKPDILVDVGAHIGLYSCILLRKALVPRAILFEPNPPTLVQLRTNLLLNDVLDRAEIHECAVGDGSGRATLEPGPDRNSGQARLVAGGTGHAIDVVAVDDVLDVSGQTLAIKMDAERYELRALAGMERLLTRNRGFVQIETLDTREEVTQLMKKFGYSQTADFYWDLYFEKA